MFDLKPAVSLLDVIVEKTIGGMHKTSFNQYLPMPRRKSLSGLSLCFVERSALFTFFGLVARQCC
jgi:hypothetical protein